MNESQTKSQPRKRVDTKEFEIPETVYVRDIENRVFQQIVLQSLTRIDGVELAEGGFIDNIFGRTSGEGIKGIYAEQDSKNHSVFIRVDISVRYGVSIPKKAEEIQTKVSEDITTLTGLHVSSVHVVFRSIFSTDIAKRAGGRKDAAPNPASDQLEEEYTDDF